MEKNMNENIDCSVENNLIEAKPQETMDNAGYNIYFVNTKSDFTNAKENFIAGASYMLGAGSIMATTTLLAFTIINIRDNIKERKKAKKLKKEFETKIRIIRMNDHDQT